MMNGRFRTVVMSAVAVALMLPAAAQAGAVPGPVDVARAKLLRARAEALFEQPKSWGKAAKLLEESAALRAADDAEAYDCLVSAARIRAALGDNAASERNFRQAAEHALARGAVMDAAQGYVFAAHAAKRDGDVQSATELVEKARLLTNSPLLGATERATVLELIS
jgi:hypothetical protein